MTNGDGGPEQSSGGSEPVAVEVVLQRIAMTHEALRYYDERRLMITVYAITVSAALVSLPGMGAGQAVLTEMLGLADGRAKAVVVFALVALIATFNLMATLIYTSGCYRLSAFIRTCEATLPGPLRGERPGRHDMTGSIATSVFVMFAGAFWLLSVGVLFYVAH